MDSTLVFADAVIKGSSGEVECAEVANQGVTAKLPWLICMRPVITVLTGCGTPCEEGAGCSRKAFLRLPDGMMLTFVNLGIIAVLRSNT